MKLTKQKIDALTCPPGKRDVLVFDSEINGFAVRVSPDRVRQDAAGASVAEPGAKTFIFQYRRGKIVRRLRLGRYGQITPAEARRLAEVARGQVLAGGDPAGDRIAAREAEAEAAQQRRAQAEEDALTVRRLVGRWEVEHLAHRRPRYRTEAVRALLSGLGELLDQPARAITPAQVREVLAKIPKPAGPAMRGHAMALRVRAYGASCCGWAMRAELVTENPFASVRLAAREVARERVLTDAEIGEVWRAAGGLGAPWGPYVRFLALTLQRATETAGLRWAELAADLSTWTLPATRTKNRRGHIVHLSEPARAILRDLPRFWGSDFVFTTTGRSPVSGQGHAKARLDAAIVAERSKRAPEGGGESSPLVPWRFHDFRRTGVTTLARKGVQWEVADKVLNHVAGAIQGVAAIYQRHEYLTERAAALDEWAAHVVRCGADVPVTPPDGPPAGGGARQDRRRSGR